MAATAVCLDQDQNSIDCGSADCTYGDCETNIGPPLATNPVALSTASPSGTSALSNSSFFTSLFNSLPALTSSIGKAVSGSSTPSGLRLQVNPATGLQQYFNPSTGQYVGSPITSTGSILGGNSFVLVIIALIVAFFAFGGLKHREA